MLVNQSCSTSGCVFTKVLAGTKFPTSYRGREALVSATLSSVKSAFRWAQKSPWFAVSLIMEEQSESQWIMWLQKP